MTPPPAGDVPVGGGEGSLSPVLTVEMTLACIGSWSGDGGGGKSGDPALAGDVKSNRSIWPFRGVCAAP